MEQIAISKFKATCLAVLEDVRRTRVPVRITRFGRPVADILPPAVTPGKSWLGCMREAFEAAEDIVEPVGAFQGWTDREP